MKKILSIIALCSISSSFVFAQDDLLGDLQKADSAIVKQNITIATFKSTRIINMQSTEMTGVGNMEFMVSHHFGQLWDKTQGAANATRLFGINGNGASTAISFDYTPISFANLGITFAGANYLEGNAKFKILRQQTGLHNYPVSIAWLSNVRFNAAKGTEISPNDLYWNRFSYLHQILISRKFTEDLSVELIPSLVHYNVISYGYANEHNVYSIGFGGRYKIAAKKAITIEYSRQLNMYKNVIDATSEVTNYNPNLFSLGYDWDTGGHIFQFFVTNTSNASNQYQLSTNPKTNNFGQWSLGFNLNRSYSIKHKVKTQHL